MRVLFAALLLAVTITSAEAAKWTVFANLYGPTIFGDTISASDKDTVDVIFAPNGRWGTVSAFAMLDSTLNAGCDEFAVVTQFFPIDLFQTDMVPGDSTRNLTVAIDSLEVLSLADTVYWENATGDSTGLVDYTGSDGTKTKFMWSEDYTLLTAGVVRHIVSCGTGCSYMFMIHVHMQ